MTKIITWTFHSKHCLTIKDLELSLPLLRESWEAMDYVVKKRPASPDIKADKGIPGALYPMISDTKAYQGA